jgi:hypothetical protein
MDWHVAQEVEHLLCKHEALSSNSSPTKKNKNKNKIAVTKRVSYWHKERKRQGKKETKLQ